MIWLAAAIAAPGICPPGFLLDEAGICARWDAPWGAALDGAPTATRDGVVLAGGATRWVADQDPTVLDAIVRIDAGGRATRIGALAAPRVGGWTAALDDGSIVIWGGYADLERTPVEGVERFGPGGSRVFD